jgi:hypothetical protein
MTPPIIHRKLQYSKKEGDLEHILSGTVRSTAGLKFILVCIFAGMQAQAEIPAMTGHFPLDETGTEVVCAISGAKGTLASGSEWVEGKHGGAMKVKAGTHIPHNAAHDFADESFSIAYWQRVPTSHGAHHPHPLSKGDYEGGELGKGVRWEFHAQGGSMRFTLDDGAIKSEATAPEGDFFTGEWVHVVGVRDSEKKKVLIYADGVLKGEVEDGSGSIANPVDLVIGDASRDDNFVPGDLDDIRFFRLVLTEAQIKEVMEAKATSISPFAPGRHRIWAGEKLAFYTPGLEQKLYLEDHGFRSIEIIDVHGRVLRALPVSPEVFWNGRDKTGAAVESGVYIVRLLGKGHTHHQPLVLAR